MSEVVRFMLQRKDAIEYVETKQFVVRSDGAGSLLIVLDPEVWTRYRVLRVRQSVDQIGLALADFLDGKRPAIWLEWLEEEDYGEDEG